MVPSGFFHFWGYISPLRNATSLAELENYPMEDLAQWDCSGIAAAVAKSHTEGKIASGWVGHMYETAWQIRGYEEFLVDMMDRPAWAECLLERIAQQNMIRATAVARAGADELQCGDDVANQQAMMFAPDLWRKMMLSRWSRIWAEVKRINPKIRIWYHSDGNITCIIDDLIRAGLDVLNPVQPECLDVDALHKKYGRQLTFHGLIGTQSTMPFGTPKSVRARVKEIIEKYGQSGGVIIAPTHVLEPDVPIANIDAFCEACREFGALG
jgi:uroporphyrinogen decarboxylase